MTQKCFPADWATSEMVKQWCRNQRRAEKRRAKTMHDADDTAFRSRRKHIQNDRLSEDHDVNENSHSAAESRHADFIEGSSSGSSSREPRALRSSTRRPPAGGDDIDSIGEPSSHDAAKDGASGKGRGKKDRGGKQKRNQKPKSKQNPRRKEDAREEEDEDVDEDEDK